MILAPHEWSPGDRVPDLDATVERVADRRTTSESRVVEVWFTDHAPLGFLPAYPVTFDTIRSTP